MKKITSAIFIALLICSSLFNISVQAKGLDYTDKASMLAEIKAENVSVLPHLSKALRKDKDFMFQAAKAFFPVLKVADPSLLKDKAFMIKLVTEERSALTYADESLKKDKDVVRAAIVKNKSQNESTWRNAHPSLKKDKDFILSIVRQLETPISTLNYVDESLKKDKDFVLEMLKEGRGSLIMFATEEFKNDKDICRLALKTNGHLLEYFGKDIKDDKELVLKAVTGGENFGGALEYASARLKKDKDVVLRAIKSISYAYEHADSSLKKDKNIVLAAAKSHAVSEYKLKYFFEMIEPNFKNDKDILAVLNN